MSPVHSGKPRIVSQGVVYSGENGSRTQSATFPLACVADSGRWFVMFRGAPDKVRTTGQQVWLTWSDTEGREWSPPIEPFAPPTVGGRDGLLRFGGLTQLGEGRLFAAVNWVDHSQPELPYFNESNEGLLDTRIFHSVSLDGGASWGPLTLMNTSPFIQPTPLTGPVLRLRNGELACQFELNKHYDAPEPWHHAAVMKFSRDGGRTWPEHRVVAQDPANRIHYWDQRPAVLPDGRILDLFWTFDRHAAAYHNIHARESDDNWRTWSQMWDTGVPGQPGPVFPLAGGAIAMPFVDRTGAPAIKVRTSVDAGRSWPAESESVVYASDASQNRAKASTQDAWSEMEAFSVGLPHAAPLPGGGALVVYYAGPERDRTAIRWAVVR